VCDECTHVTVYVRGSGRRGLFSIGKDELDIWLMSGGVSSYAFRNEDGLIHCKSGHAHYGFATCNKLYALYGQYFTEEEWRAKVGSNK